MVLDSILHPLPSTHAHTHKHRSNSNSNSNHTSPPAPGLLPHASTLPATLDTHNHKHYHPHQAAAHHSNTTTNSNHHIPNPATYISKHHQEYTLQHSFKSAKHAARTSIDTAMPDFSPPISKTSTTNSTSANRLTSEPAPLSPEDRARLQQAEAEAADAAERQHEQDQQAWQKIVAAREAAARRRTIGEEDERPQMEAEWRGMSEGSVRTEGSR